MNAFIRQYCKIIAYSLMGLVFAFASFFLIINLYHQSEISRIYPVNFEEDAAMKKFNHSISTIDENLKDFNSNRYKGDLTAFQIMTAHAKLKECSEKLNSDVMKEFQSKKEISIVDVYLLRESFENDVLGSCVVSDLGWFAKASTNQVKSDYLLQNEKLLTIYLDGLKGETSYLKKDLLNNSSFYFNTALVASTLRNNVKDGYYELIASYNKVASITEDLSKWFYEETKEAN